MNEQRKFLRFPLHLKTVLLTFENGESAQAQAENISRQGMGLEAESQSFHEGARVKISLALESGSESSIFTGKVVWVDCEKNTKKVGLTIEDMNLEQKNVILEKAYKSWLDQERLKYENQGLL